MGEIREADFIHFIQEVLFIDTTDNKDKNEEIDIQNDDNNCSTLSCVEPNVNLHNTDYSIGDVVTSLKTQNSSNMKNVLININSVSKHKFTEREQKLLEFFQTNSNQIIRAKEVADILDIPRDYSYKHINNLKNKLNKLGHGIIRKVDGGYIYTEQQACNFQNNNGQNISSNTMQPYINNKQTNVVRVRNTSQKHNAKSEKLNCNTIDGVLSTETINFLKRYRCKTIIETASGLQILKQKYQAKNKIIDELLDYIIKNKVNITKTIYPDSRRLRNYNLTPNLLSVLYSKGSYWLDNLNNTDVTKMMKINGMGAKSADELLDLLYAENIDFVQKNPAKRRLKFAQLSSQAKGALYKYNIFYYEDLENIDLFSFKKHTETTVKPFEEIITFLINNNIKFKQYTDNKRYVMDFDVTPNTKTALYNLMILYIEDINIDELQQTYNIGKNIIKEVEQIITNQDKNDSIKIYLTKLIQNMQSVTIGSLLDCCLNDGYNISQNDIQRFLNETCIKTGKNSYIYNKSL